MAGRIRVDEIASSVNDSPQAPFGLRFPNTDQSGSTILDWYEEGTWTPVMIGATSAGAGTYTAQGGYYTRIGNVVNFSLRITTTNHTGTGSIMITLPFIPKVQTNTSHAFVFPCNVSNLTFSTGSFVHGYSATDGTAYARLIYNGNNIAYGDVVMDTAFTITMSGMFLV